MFTNCQFTVTSSVKRTLGRMLECHISVTLVKAQYYSLLYRHSTHTDCVGNRFRKSDGSAL